VYQCRVDLTDVPSILRGQAQQGAAGGSNLALRPLFKSVVVSNSLDMAVGDGDTAYVHGTASLRNNSGPSMIGTGGWRDDAGGGGGGRGHWLGPGPR
jgi:hypothetical protein